MIEIKFLEQERAIFDSVPSTWTQFTNGTLITDKGYKWYPSGIVTTPNDEVFPTRASNIEQFIAKFTADDGFVNEALKLADLPAGFKFRADGALVAPIGLIAYSDGWVVTSDGFVVSSQKMTFVNFVNLYSKTTSVKVANNRTWPRPLSTTKN